MSGFSALEPRVRGDLSRGSKRSGELELLEDEIRLAVAQLRPAYASPAELAHEHRRLITAIATKDTSRALELLREHLDQAVGELTADAIRRQP
jgi:DNA-binding GntR family transcriptional regulator